MRRCTQGNVKVASRVQNMSPGRTMPTPGSRPPDMQRKRPTPPPSRYRLGYTGIEWNVGDPMPQEAKRAILAEKLVWGAIIGGFAVAALVIGAVATFGG